MSRSSKNGVVLDEAWAHPMVKNQKGDGSSQESRRDSQARRWGSYSKLESIKRWEAKIINSCWDGGCCSASSTSTVEGQQSWWDWLMFSEV